jgi:prophage regulatory protein
MTRLPAKTKGPVRAHHTGDTSPDRFGSRDGHHAALDPGSDHSHRAALKFLRFPAVRERTGLSRSTIWRLEREGAFPRHHRISANAVAWIEDDIAKWIQSKVAAIAV